MKNTYLAIDQGTQSSRALLFDTQGNLLHQQQMAVGLQRHSRQCIEQDADEILDSICQVVHLLLNGLSQKEYSNILACGICSQRSSVVAVDRLIGKVLSPVLSWQDTRAADTVANLSEHSKQIRQISGLPLSAHYGASKMQWLMDWLTHEKSLQAEQVCLMPLAGYLVKGLCGSDRWIVDQANAQRTQLMSVHNGHWSEELLSYFQLDTHVLPDCHAIEAHYGELLNTDIPVLAVSGDQNAAFFGNGEFEQSVAWINLGSGAFVMTALALEDIPDALLATQVRTSNSVEQFVCEGTVNGAGTALKWAEKNWSLGDVKQQLPEWLASVQVPPIWINTIGGIGSPWWRSDLTPRFLDAAKPSKAEQAVAVVESIVFLLMDNLSLMRQKKPLRKIMLSGGLSKLDGLCQKLANLSDLPVERMEMSEASGRGIAWLAAGCPSGWQAPGVAGFEPLPDAGLAERYQRAHQFLASS